MKHIFLRHILEYFRTTHFKKMMADTGLEEHKGLAKNKFLPIVKATIEPFFKGERTIHFKITKEVVQNFEKEFKKDFNKNNKKYNWQFRYLILI